MKVSTIEALEARIAPAVLSIVAIDSSKSEGSTVGSDTHFSFKVTLDAADLQDVTVTVTAHDGTAKVADNDFDAFNQQIIIPAGQTEVTFDVPIHQDTKIEADETFSVSLSSPSDNATLGTDSSATATILNDDIPALKISDATLVEGHSGQTDMQFTVTLDAAALTNVTVDYATHDGTAIKTSDYSETTGTLTFAPGETSKVIKVPILGDTNYEGDETFTVGLTNASGASIAQGHDIGTGTIQDDDTELSISDATLSEGNSGHHDMEFTVTLKGAHTKAVTFDWATADGTAKSSGPLLDFLARNGSLTFDPTSDSTQTKTISIPILGDTWKEAAEKFSVKLSNAKLGGDTAGVTISNDTGTGTIQDDGDTTLGLIVHDQKMAEGKSGTKNMEFLVETTAPVDSDLVLTANTRYGAANSSDFTALTDSPFTIAATQSQATVKVPIVGDSNFEPTEHFFLDVTGFGDSVKPVNGGSVATAFGVILNDDIHKINGHEFQYVDVDGDLVTVKFSKGSLRIQSGDSASSSDNIQFDGSISDLGGRAIKMMDLSMDGFKYTGVNISMVAKPQVLVTGEVLGDGKANVGTISAAVLQPDLFQVTIGVNLGHVTIPGNLNQLIAGYTLRPAGVSFLEVDSFGSDTNVGSVVLGPIGKMVVHGDFMGNLRVIGDSSIVPLPSGSVGNIGNLIIEGALKGGTNEGSGRITFTGRIGNATIGSIEGGSGKASATLVSFSDDFVTSIGSLKVLGDFSGASGENSGLVEADTIGSVSIGKYSKDSAKNVHGNLVGGTGDLSGLIVADRINNALINGDIQGGSGETAGHILAKDKLGSMRITGSVFGSEGAGSGSIETGSVTGSLKIEGDLKGASGDNSGVIIVNGAAGNLNSITLGKEGVQSGSLIGGEGEGSGRIEVVGSINSFTAYGNIEGFSGSKSTGALVVHQTLKNAVVKGNIVGGDSDDSNTDGLVGSGYIDAQSIGSVTVGGTMTSGANNGGGLAKSGGIFSVNRIDKINVNSVEGSEEVPVLISALRGIGSATFGDVTFLELLAGYANADADHPRGLLVDAGASISKVVVKGKFTASSIVAGVEAGADKLFGTDDDTQDDNGDGGDPGNQKATSQIGSVVLHEVGAVPEDVTGEVAYGIVAEHVKSLTVGEQKISLSSGAHNDQEQLGADEAKLQIIEI